ncbi:hypothetical protein GQ44DRAFT_786201 [Phaeosphaeriaceae sp. PMI808]|nr:hypothetical protein GQ44DRAFT_786201 [Phaeosphaeriaceae sp. PMI808]
MVPSVCYQRDSSLLATIARQESDPQSALVYPKCMLPSQSSTNFTPCLQPGASSKLVMPMDTGSRRIFQKALTLPSSEHIPAKRSKNSKCEILPEDDSVHRRLSIALSGHNKNTGSQIHGYLSSENHVRLKNAAISAVCGVFETRLLANELLPHEFEEYKDNIVSFCSVKDATVRKQHRLALVDFFQQHHKAAVVHNMWARRYNGSFKGFPEKQLPICEESHSIKETIKGNIANDIEEVEDRFKMEISAMGSRISPTVGFTRERTMCGLEDFHMQPVGKSCKTTFAKRDMPQPEPLKSHTNYDVEKIAQKKFEMLAQNITRHHLSDRTVTQMLAQPYQGTHREQQNDRESIEKKPNPSVSGNVDLKPSKLMAKSPPHFANQQAVQSYLAWLHLRQVRFPTVAPNSCECAMIARKFGNHPTKVYDEVLYHWGLETGSKDGEWYRRNRVKVLGQDPSFDSDTLGWWEAWLLQAGDDAQEGSSF